MNDVIFVHKSELKCTKLHVRALSCANFSAWNEITYFCPAQTFISFSWPRLYSIPLACVCKHPPVCKYREDDISALERDASFYEGELRELHDEAVPRFYGLFKSSYTDSARQRESYVLLLEPRLEPMG